MTTLLRLGVSSSYISTVWIRRKSTHNPYLHSTTLKNTKPKEGTNNHCVFGDAYVAVSCSDSEERKTDGTEPLCSISDARRTDIAIPEKRASRASVSACPTHASRVPALVDPFFAFQRISPDIASTPLKIVGRHGDLSITTV